MHLNLQGNDRKVKTYRGDLFGSVHLKLPLESPVAILTANALTIVSATGLETLGGLPWRHHGFY